MNTRDSLEIPSYHQRYSLYFKNDYDRHQTGIIGKTFPYHRLCSCDVVFTGCPLSPTLMPVRLRNEPLLHF